MHPIYNWHFTICLLLYAINKRMITKGADLPIFFKNHLNDFLAMPILLSCTLFTMRLLLNKIPSYVFTSYQLTFAFVYAAVVFEYLGPKIFVGKTTDWYDVVAYAAGTLFFAIFMNKKSKKIMNY